MTVRTGVTVIGPHFYRLQIYGWESGSVVEEREDLQHILAELEGNRVQLRKVTKATPTDMRFEAVDRNGKDVRVSITFYRASEPKAGWPDPDSLIGKW